MKYGDEDGFDEIYDNNGELITYPKEKILVTQENVVPSLKSTWRYYGGDYLLEPSKGTIYLTDERLVFINIPERVFAIGGGESSRAMSSEMKTSFELGKVSAGATVREYFEIPNIEIMASERKEGAVSKGVMVNVYVLSSGNQFHLSMVLDDESDLLDRLMNKKVDSLDQLVNNLKDFFQRTEWMYTESEKKLLRSKEKEAEREALEHEESVEETDDTQVPPEGEEAPEPTKDETEEKSMPHIGSKIKSEANSIKYFRTLFEKGLITEKIYQRLLDKHGPEQMEEDEKIEKAVSPGDYPAPTPPPPPPLAGNIDNQGKVGDDFNVEMQDTDSVPMEVTEEGREENEEIDDDKKLMDMIDSTLAGVDLGEGSSESGPEETGEETPPNTNEEEIEDQEEKKTVHARKKVKLKLKNS